MLLDALKDVVSQVAAGLEPASLFRYEFQASGLQRNRRQDPSYFDPTANLLLVQDASGDWIGAMVNLAIDGTALGETNLEYSADVPGVIERRFEEALQADTGNANDVPVHHGVDGMNRTGSEFAAQAMARIGTRQSLAGTWTVEKSEVDIESAFLYYAPLRAIAIRRDQQLLGELEPPTSRRSAPAISTMRSPRRSAGSGAAGQVRVSTTTG